MENGIMDDLKNVFIRNKYDINEFDIEEMKVEPWIENILGPIQITRKTNGITRCYRTGNISIFPSDFENDLKNRFFDSV